MDELSISIDNNRTLWLTEISRETFESQALHELGTDGGLFLCIEDSAEGTFDVVAKAAPGFAGQQLLEALSRAMATRNPRFEVVS